MRAFKVYLNRKRLCTAGVGDDGVLTATVTWAGEQGTPLPSSLYVGGTIGPTDEHVEWTTRRLQVGDEISIKVVGEKSVDKPRRRIPRDPVQELKWDRRYVRAMAKKFGWKISRGS